MTDSAPGVELLDVTDEFGHYLRTAPRDEVHERGDWHRVFHCQIVTLRDGEPTAVLQRRTFSKAAFPGLLDISAAGHLSAGEAPLDGIRELAEELGVEADPSSLMPLGVRKFSDGSGEGAMNRELISVYMLRDDRPLDDYVLAPDEVDAVFDVPIAGFLSLFDGTPSLCVGGVAAAGHPNAHAITTDITIGDLVPGSEYWIVLMVMAERYLAGKHPLAV